MRLISLSRLAVAVAVSLVVCAQAQARGLTPAERASLNRTVTEFATATRANDAPNVVKSVPPAILAFIAKSQGVQPAALRQQMIAQSAQSQAQVKLVSLTLDMTKAKHLTLTNGAPYALIPTDMVMQIGPTKRELTSYTLALLDKGQWYLVRISSLQQVKLLVQSYPEFAGAKFTPEINKVVP
jgi:hypothetical protein